MKQMESVANGRRANSGQRSSSGASRASQGHERGAYGGIEGASMVQRTFGNAAAGKLAGTREISPGLSAKVFSQIVERGMRGDWGGVSEKNGVQSGGVAAPQAATQSQGATTTIQRAMSSRKFNRESVSIFGKGKVGEFFKKVLGELQDFESLPLDVVDPDTALPEEVEKMEDQERALQAKLRVIYKMCDEWSLTSDGESSPGASLIKKLMEGIRDDLSPEEAPKDNKAGTALGKSSNVTVDRLAKLTPEQEQAIEVIDKTTLHKRRKEHCHDMIRNPEMIQQGAFGVCGLTSILHAVAKATPVRFAEIIRDAWADTALVTEWLDVFYNNADPRHIEIRSEVEYIAAQWIVRKSQTGEGSSFQLDQEQIDENSRKETQTEKTQQYKDVLERQKKFSDTFEIDGWENTLGHFALTAGAVSHLLNGLGTGKPSYKIKRKSLEKDLAMVESLKGSNSSVLASVTNTEFYEEGKDVSTDYEREDGTKGGSKPFVGPREETDTTPKGGPKYVHWVILKGAKLGTDGFYELDIWTWGNNYKARVHKDVIYSHIYSLVVAQSKMW